MKNICEGTTYIVVCATQTTVKNLPIPLFQSSITQTISLTPALLAGLWYLGLSAQSKIK